MQGFCKAKVAGSIPAPGTKVPFMYRYGVQFNYDYGRKSHFIAIYEKDDDGNVLEWFDIPLRREEYYRTINFLRSLGLTVDSLWLPYVPELTREQHLMVHARFSDEIAAKLG